MDPRSESVTNNLYVWADLTALCLVLRRSVLAASFPDLSSDAVEEKLFAEIRAFKEQQWRTNRT